MRLAFTAICFLILLQPTLSAQSEFELIGFVQASDQNGLADVKVKIIGGDFRITGNSGEFRIPIPKAKIGHKITLKVNKKGWVVADARDLSVIVPADPSQNPIKITLKRLGAPSASKAQNKSANTTSSLKPVLPTFRETKEKLTVVIGSQPFIVNAKDSVNSHFAPLAFDDYTPFKLGYKNGKLYVDAKILNFGASAEARPAVEMTQNEFTVRPFGWSYNLNEKAVEIVDNQGLPRFQMIYQSDSRILIYGVFPIPGGVQVLCADQRGINPKPPQGFSCGLKPIFKYPSWKYPGIYAE